MGDLCEAAPKRVDGSVFVGYAKRGTRSANAFSTPPDADPWDDRANPLPRGRDGLGGAYQRRIVVHQIARDVADGEAVLADL